MKFRKTNQSQRSIYKYIYEVPNGKGGYKKITVVLKSGKEGVTEKYIKELHSLDDKEVISNLKNSKPEKTKEEKNQIKKFRTEFIEKFKKRYGCEPGKDYINYKIEEAFPKNYKLSLDYDFEKGIDYDKSKVIADTSIEIIEDYEWLDEINIAIEKLTEKQK